MPRENCIECGTELCDPLRDEEKELCDKCYKKILDRDEIDY